VDIFCTTGVNCTSAFNGGGGATICVIDCNFLDPQLGPNTALLFPTRIETGSALKSAGVNVGEDIGANVVQRYGVDGTFYGDAGSQTLQAPKDLWPWPNEARIMSEMCPVTGAGSNNRGMCTFTPKSGVAADKTFTTYIWETYGNQIPACVYLKNCP
jgi:hypothetical protein